MGEARALATITACPATPGETATYVVAVENVAARGGDSAVDRVDLDFSGVGSQFDGVEPADVTLRKNPRTDPTPLAVAEERTSLSGVEPTVGVARERDGPSVSTGDTLLLCLAGVENPSTPGKYTAGIRLEEVATGERAGALETRWGQFLVGI